MMVARLVVLGALSAGLPAGANDTAVTLGAGGLIPAKSSAIVMESENLQISVRQVTVKYVFRNTSNRDVDVMVAFPFPEMDGGAVANIMMNIPSRDPLNFMDFNVVVAGKRITPDVEIRAFTDAGEITSQLRSFGLPLSVLDGNITRAIEKLDKKDRSRLESSGLFDCSLTKDGKCWPYWKSRAQFYWTQRFLAGSSVEVQHVYRPIVGGGSIYADDTGETSVKPYCGGGEALKQIDRQKELHRVEGRDKPVLRERTIDYILTTANNWAGPIHKFRLSVVSDNSDDIVVTCMPGLKRVAPTRYELVRSDFRPDRDLRLLILQRGE